eukprot:scaffold24065_cov37-Phaeocystis_antarctica.AAC.2
MVSGVRPIISAPRFTECGASSYCASNVVVPCDVRCCMSFFTIICPMPSLSRPCDNATAALRRPEFTPLECGRTPSSSPSSEYTSPARSASSSVVVKSMSQLKFTNIGSSPAERTSPGPNSTLTYDRSPALRRAMASSAENGPWGHASAEALLSSGPRHLLRGRRHAVVLHHEQRAPPHDMFMHMCMHTSSHVAARRATSSASGVTDIS